MRRVARVGRALGDLVSLARGGARLFERLIRYRFAGVPRDRRMVDASAYRTRFARRQRGGKARGLSAPPCRFRRRQHVMQLVPARCSMHGGSFAARQFFTCLRHGLSGLPVPGNLLRARLCRLQLQAECLRLRGEHLCAPLFIFGSGQLGLPLRQCLRGAVPRTDGIRMLPLCRVQRLTQTAKLTCARQQGLELHHAALRGLAHIRAAKFGLQPLTRLSGFALLLPQRCGRLLHRRLRSLLVALGSLELMDGRPCLRGAPRRLQANPLFIHGHFACQQGIVCRLRVGTFAQPRRDLFACLQRCLRGGQGGARGLFVLLQVLEFLPQLCDAFGQRLGRRHLQLPQQRLAPVANAFGLALDAGRLGLQQLFHAPVQLGAEQTLQDGLARLRAGGQQFAKSPLRQHDDLAELRAVEAQQFANGLGDLGRLPGLADPALSVPGVELGLGGLVHHAFAALLRPLLRWRPHDAVALGAKAELEHDLRARPRRRVGAAHGLGGTLAAGGVAI